MYGKLDILLEDTTMLQQQFREIVAWQERSKGIGLKEVGYLTGLIIVIQKIQIHLFLPGIIYSC